MEASVSLNNFSWGVGNFLKRMMDIVLAVTGIIILSPFLFLVALLIKRESPGPIFYGGKRMGKDGKPFLIWKFRTMYETPESHAGPAVTATGDRRITPFGQWLRDTKVNELAQLWNVLVGDMSMVGPRPEDYDIAMKWPEDARTEIVSVRPGVTSPASIIYHDEEKLLQGDDFMTIYYQKILPDKIRLDRIYVRHHTLLGDLDIIFWTLAVLLPRLASQRILEGNLFGGPISRFVRFNLLWFLVDFLIAFVAISVVGLIWRSAGPLELGIGRAILLGLAMALLAGLINAGMGLNRVVWNQAVPEDMFGIIFSTALMTLIVSVTQFTAQIYGLLPPLPSQLIFTMGLVVLIGVVGVRYRWHLLTGFASLWFSRRSSFSMGERVLIIGAGQGLEFALWLLRRESFRPIFSIVGIVDDDPFKQGMRYAGAWVVGTSADISAIVKKHDVGLIMLSVMSASADEQKRIYETCIQTDARLLLVSDMMRALHVWLTASKKTAAEADTISE